MKSFYKLLFFSVLLTCCNNDDDNAIAPIDQLPLITQTGEGTFGCLVNGEPFIDNSGNFNCFYQFVNGDYYFSISPNDNIFIDQIRIASEAFEISVGNFELNCLAQGEIYAEISFNGLLLSSETCGSDYASVTFTRLDLEQNIVSGTFEFDITNPQDSSIIEVRAGRFDSFFTE